MTVTQEHLPVTQAAPLNGQVLVAVCDVLCVKALESLGKWIVRADRSRFRLMAGRSFDVAHTIWQADAQQVSKSLKGAWDVVPAILDNHGYSGPQSAQVMNELDQYVKELATFKSPHTYAKLQARMERLGVRRG